MENQKNKVVLITGGSKGIGYGIAEALLKAGHQVAITSRSQASADQAAADLQQYGDIIGIAADVKDLTSQKAAGQTGCSGCQCRCWSLCTYRRAG
jgi:3-oxoacyl-[acyl-carrier protein] reductase